MRISIRTKFLAGFTLILLLAFLFLNYFVREKIGENNEKTVSQELLTLRENCNVYIRQAFVINQYNNNSTYFKKLSRDIAEELSGVIGSDVGAYTLQGELIDASGGSHFNEAAYEDLRNAVNEKTAYTLRYQGDTVEAYFSYPVVIEDNKVGILRILRDYSKLYQQGREVTDFVFLVTLVIFAAVFLFSFLLSRNITLPLTKLARYTNEVARGNMQVGVSSRRKDEIGELYANFGSMVQQIDRQLTTIRQDRDELRQLIDHKKAFYDNVTHELKTPLTSILGYAQMIRDNGFHDEEFFDKGTGHIINESKRLHTMVLNLLELSQQNSDREEPYEKTDLGRLLAEACENMTFKAQRYGNVLRPEAGPGQGFFVNGNGNKLKQVLINILDNAIKYGLPGEEVRAGITRSEGQVILEITNRGEGIPEDALDKLFTPFYRLNRQKSRELGSSGLGLAISKEIVEQHGGEIGIRSSQNGETTVTIRLPAYSNTVSGEGL